ncbi:MAG: GGDEF domain-containing protein [Pseudomonadota bacterium]
MNLDARTLLFSLFLIYGLSVPGMFCAATCRSGGRTRDGLGKWAAAMFLETLTWALIAARGTIPDFFSVVVSNGLLAAAHALMLAAVYEFQRRQAPRWQYWLPVALTVLMAAVLVDDIRGRFIWGSIIYGFQMILIGRALISDKETRAGRSWQLLFGGIVLLLLVLALRAITALSGFTGLTQLQNNAPIHPFQVISYIALMAIALLGSIGFVLLVKERTDREIMHLAMTDSLTQIPNRRALMDFAARVLARRSGLPLALLMIDVDHFKLINDTYGHLTGDDVLCKIAALFEGRLRGHDLLGRYGGEEFCVVAPDTDTKGALALAESLRNIISSASFATAKGALFITVSIGIACCPLEVMRNLKEVLAEADTALYDAKQTGRNKVVCFGIENA